MIKAVIFDLDGVLVSTDRMHYLAWKRLADELGITEFGEKEAVRQRGVSRMASLEILLEKSSTVYSDEEKIALADRKNSYYVKTLEALDENAVLPGALDTLKTLKKLGVATAVGSASKNAQLILSKTGLSSYIDAVACGLDVTKSKPDPQVFLCAAEKLGIEPEFCMIVEDAYAGVEAAKNGNMTAFAVGAAKYCPLADARADDMLGFFDQLSEILN